MNLHFFFSIFVFNKFFFKLTYSYVVWLTLAGRIVNKQQQQQQQQQNNKKQQQQKKNKKTQSQGRLKAETMMSGMV